MTKWHALVAHMAKHMNLVGGPFWVGVLGPRTPLNPALSYIFETIAVTKRFLIKYAKIHNKTLCQCFLDHENSNDGMPYDFCKKE